jgi:N6-adenosine-specific RNA methylase IME4
MGEPFDPSFSSGLSTYTGEHLATAGTSDIAVVLTYLTGKKYESRHGLAVITTLSSAKKIPDIGKGYWVADAEEVWNYFISTYGEARVLAGGSDWQMLVTRARDYAEKYQGYF